jgi:hypothetical protein
MASIKPAASFSPAFRRRKSVFLKSDLKKAAVLERRPLIHFAPFSA